MPEPEDFDAFYLSTRRRLVLQAYALTGDLSAGRRAVREAYVAARHRWHKVGRLPDPEEWVRQRAWATAQRRHAARLWHREKGITTEQKAVLDTLHRLPDQQRKVVLLTHLAALSSAEIGRELGERPARVEERLARATRAFCERTGRDPEHVREALESLAPIAEATALPAPSLITSSGRRRGRWQATAAAVTLLVLTVVGGLFVVSGTDDPASARAGAGAGAGSDPVTRSMLVSPAQVQDLDPEAVWRLTGTSDNTAGTGINTVCQATRFADPRGRGTLVRTYSTSGPPRRTFLETVEVSRGEGAARAAYRTTLGWFAGCSQARLQLLGSYRLQGLADEAMVLKLRVPTTVRRTYVVGLARTGSLTVSTVSETSGGRPVEVDRAVTGLTSAVGDVCRSDPGGTCPTTVAVSPVLPPRSGETPGTLAAADLPAVGRINRPWVGTTPVRARPNVAATTCDRADFVRSGSPRAATRTFLIPQARLPRRFGITETYGAFRNPALAQAFVRRVTVAMAGCEKKDLGARVSAPVTQSPGYRGSIYSLWRLDSEISDGRSVGFWMGIARVGRYVAQVNFTPTGSDDVGEDTFQALVARARDRLFELAPAGS